MIFPSAGAEERHRATVAEAVTLHLFTNDIRPTEAVTVRNLREATLEIGYEPRQLTRDGWKVRRVTELAPDGTTVSLLRASRSAKWVFARGDATIYGHYALDARGTIAFVDRFDEPFEVRRPGDWLVVDVEVDGFAARDAALGPGDAQ